MLLWVNWRSYDTISGDLGEESALIRSVVLGSGIALVVAHVALAAWLIGRRLSPAVSIVGLLPPMAYLTYLILNVWSAIPDGASRWILTEERVMIHQLTGLMPAILYFGLVLMANKAREMASAFVGAVCLSGLAMLSVAVIDADASPVLVVALMMLAMLFSLGLLRALIGFYKVISKASPGWLPGMGFLLAGVFPFVGLYVNKEVPFPYDFQTTGVYVLAAVNVLVLSLPRFSNPVARRFLWVCQCVMLPFTLYFFVTFLPFFPFAVPGLMVYGGGLLVLVPVALALFHGGCVWDGFLVERDHGGPLRPMLLGLVAFCSIPCVMFWRAGHDRVVLHQALDYAYSGTPTADARFDGDPASLERTLDSLVDFKPESSSRSSPICTTARSSTV